MRFRQPMPSAALLLLFACAPQSAERGGSTPCAQEVEAARAQWHAEKFEQLEVVANHLEGILAGHPLATTKAEPDLPEVSDPEMPPVGGQVPLQPTTQQLEVAIAKIEWMAQGVGRQFADLEKVQRELKDEIRLLRRDSTAGIDHTREAILKQGEELGAQFSEDRTREEQLETLRHQRDTERQQFQAQAGELAMLIRSFDRAKLNCTGCGKGFSDRFGRELLSFHSELLAQLDALEGSVE